jgi:DNA helicase-2/ATP-dependent DNA helicase PcrA
LFYGRNGNDDALGVAIPVHSLLCGGQEIGGNPIVAFIHEWHLNTPPGQRTVSAYLEWLSTFDIQDEIPPADPDGPGVITLATIHGSKGLEWPYVILAGCNEGILPSDRAVKSGDLEEERRLAYVAITRARDCLTLAVRPERSEKPGRDGQMQVYMSPVSRFVAEAMGGGE